MTAQLGLPLHPAESPRKRASQCAEDCDRVIKQSRAKYAHLYPFADKAAEVVLREHNGVTGWRLKQQMIAMGFGELIDPKEVHPTWTGGYLNPSNGWVRVVGEEVGEGSNGRKQPVWRRAAR